MQQKRKTGKKLLSFLLTLAMLIGLVPGMSLKAYAAPAETLLTTITATGKDTYSESTEGVVNVTLRGITSYNNAYGWFGGRVTVTQKEGYTITKCRFNADSGTVDDTEEPFTFSNNRNYVKTVEVYGYQTSAQAAANNIIINSAEHGSVTANPASAESGTTVTLTAQPDEGYKLKNISASYEGIVPDSFSYQYNVNNYSGTQFNLYSNYPDVGWRVGYGTSNKISVTSKSDTSKIDRVVLEAHARLGIRGTIKANVGTVTRNGNTITVSDINNTTVTIYSEDEAYSPFVSAEVYGKTADYVELTLTGTDDPNVFTFTMPDSAVSVSAEFEVAYTALTDENKPTITVSNDHNPPQIGDTLTAATTATDITYSWHYSDSEDSLGTDSTYTVKKEDVGKQIVVTATQTKDENGNEITGVKPTQSSGMTAVVEKKTPATIDTNTAKTNAGISFSDEKATPIAGYEISTDGSTPATLKEGSLSLTSILDGDTPKIYVRTAATDDTAAGAWVEVALASRPAAPTDLTTNNADNKTSANGKINGVDTTKEYSSDGGNTWTPVQGTTIDNLNPGIYLVRTKATADAPAGKTTEVKVGSKENILEDGQKPEAKSDLVYTSEEQSLVNAPADKLPEWADKIQYAIGTDETTKPEASAYTDAIPTGSDSGTYYVWYRVYVDDNNTSDPTLITVEISPVDKAELNKAIEEAEDYYNTIKDNPAYSEQAKALDEAIKDTKELAENKNAKDTEVSAGIIAVTEAKKKAEAEVKDIDDTAAAKKVTDAINALPASNKVATTDKEAIEAARKAYDALTEDQKSNVPADTLKKLEEAEKALADAEQKEATDTEAAKKVTDAINALPASDKIATTDKEAIEAARKAYDALTDDQKAKVPADTLKKLEDAEKALEDAEQKEAEKEAADTEAAKKVTDAINALPASDKIATTDKEAIEAARKAYDALTEDQKVKVPAETLKKLEEAEAALEVAEKDEADQAAADAVAEKINALPASDKIATTDKEAIEAARKAYDALTEDQKAKVPAETLKKLEDAEKALADAEKNTSDDDKKDEDKPDYKNEWVDGQWYGADGNTDYEGKGTWKSNETGWWYEDTTGWYPVSQWQKIDGKWYYFTADGYMDYSEYRDGCWLGSDGAWDETYSGGHWMQDSTGWWYVDSTGWYPVNQWLWIDGSCYYFYDTGYMASSTYIGSWWVNANGAWE